QGTTPRAGQTPSRACAAAILSCRAAAPNISHRAGLPGDRGRDNPQVRFDADYPRGLPERRPAPSRNSPPILAACRAVGQDATSSSSPRPVLPTNISVPAHVARHYGEFDSGKPDSGDGAAAASRPVTSVIVDRPQAISVMSSRIEHAVLQKLISLAPQ